MNKKIEKAVKSCVKRIMKIIAKENLDPLDGDETCEISDYMLIELDWANGNLSTDEYDIMKEKGE